MHTDHTIAYFSMEIGLGPSLPTYSGGLGMLAGDHLRAAADLNIPLIGVTLIHRKGYFHQHLASDGTQTEVPVQWNPEDYLEPLKQRAAIKLRGRDVLIRAWRYVIQGVHGAQTSVILLDTNLPENDPADRTITDQLYGGDSEYRLLQEAVLGIGGVRMLRQLGHEHVRRLHLNEGHASLLVLELLREQAQASGLTADHVSVLNAVRNMCVFTTHTPVDAGHDRFPMELLDRVLEPDVVKPYLKSPAHDLICRDDVCNMTYLGFNLSRFINGVAKRHGEVSRQMFGDYPIDAITNGVHVRTWAAPAMATLFDEFIPGWPEDPFSLRYALEMDWEPIWNAHRQAKRALLDHVNRETDAELDLDAFTIGFARRATAYKRADLVLRDPDRLRRLARKVGPIQLIFAGKAHPRDEPGKELIRKVARALNDLKPDVQGVYVPNYDMTLGRLTTAGCDLWLNNPRPPLEASGTSGMKAAVNGVPSLSTLDGWWLEGCLEGVTGWAIGADHAVMQNPAATAEEMDRSDREDAESMHKKLEQIIVPMFYNSRQRYVDVMRNAIALNGSFFNAHRMMLQYVSKAYYR